MLFEDRESNLIDDFRMCINNSDLLKRNVYVFSDSKDIISVIESITDEKNWKENWVDNSSKSAPPPDFYNNKERLMMEVMRVDDYTFEENGRIKNPTNQKARRLEKELKDMGVLDLNPEMKLFINTRSDLPGEKDHNYVFYKDNFKRVIEKHIAKIPLYCKNHPGKKLIFYIFDESSMYCEVEEKNKTITPGEMFAGIPHRWYGDKTFVNIFKESGIDYLIWFTPYKNLNTAGTDPDLPVACVYDCNNIFDRLIEYDSAYLMSAEA